MESVGAGDSGGNRVTFYHGGDSIGSDGNCGDSMVVIERSGAVV